MRAFVEIRGMRGSSRYGREQTAGRAYISARHTVFLHKFIREYSGTAGDTATRLRACVNGSHVGRASGTRDRLA